MGCLCSAESHPLPTWEDVDAMSHAPNLSRTDITNVRSIWKYVCGKNLGMEMGFQIFMNLFEKYPEALGFFSNLEDSSASDHDISLEEKIPIEIHVNHVMRSFVYFIDNLDNRDNFLSQLKQLQMFHQQLTGPNKAHFRKFMDLLDSALLVKVGDKVYSEHKRSSFYRFLQVLYFYITRCMTLES